MSLSKIQIRTIRKKSLEARGLCLLKDWTKHSTGQDNPTVGISCSPKAVIDLLKSDNCDRIFEIPSRGVVCVTSKANCIWFEHKLNQEKEEEE